MNLIHFTHGATDRQTAFGFGVAIALISLLILTLLSLILPASRADKSVLARLHDAGCSARDADQR